MQMTPFFSLDGVLIGHVDVSMCRRTRHSVVLDNGPDDWLTAPVPTDGAMISPDDYVEIFHIPLREILFRHHEDEVKVLHLVVDDSKLPSWFWDTKAVVAFSPGSWQRVR